MQETEPGNGEQQRLQGQKEQQLPLPPDMDRRRWRRVTARTLKSRLMAQVNREIYRRVRSAFGIVPSFLERPEDARALLAYQPPD